MYKHLEYPLCLDLTLAEKAILILLCYRADSNDECWPSLKKISEQLGLNYSRVSNSISNLARYGAIEKVKCKNGKRGYRITMKPIKKPDTNFATGKNVEKKVCLKQKQVLPQAKNTFATGKNKVCHRQNFDPAPNVEGEREGKGKGQPTPETLTPKPQTQKPPAKNPNPYKNFSTVKDIKNAKDPSYKLSGSKVVRVSLLEKLWLRVNAEVYPDKYFASLTQKDRGMLKQFLKKAGAQHAEKALYVTVKYWPDFIGYCQRVTGQKITGATPQLNPIVYHAETAVNFMRETFDFSGPGPDPIAPAGYPNPPQHLSNKCADVDVKMFNPGDPGFDDVFKEG